MRISSCAAHTAYRAGCPQCQRLGRNRFAERELGRRPRLLPHGPVAQLIRELVGQGHPYRSISAYSGVTERVIWSIASDRQTHVHENVASKIAFAYLRMRDLPGTDLRCVNRAAKRGWTVPEEEPVILDEVVIDRVMCGEHPAASRAELTEAWQRLTDAGCSAPEIAERLGVSERTLQRWKNHIPTSARRGVA